MIGLMSENTHPNEQQNPPKFAAENCGLSARCPIKSKMVAID